MIVKMFFAFNMFYQLVYSTVIAVACVGGRDLDIILHQLMKG